MASAWYGPLKHLVSVVQSGWLSLQTHFLGVVYFFHRVTQEASHCSVSHIWFDHLLLHGLGRWRWGRCAGDPTGILSLQQVPKDMRWGAEVLGKKLDSLKLFPGKSRFHIYLDLLIRSNLLLVAPAPEIAWALKWQAGISRTEKWAKQLVMPLYQSFLILAGLLALPS